MDFLFSRLFWGSIVILIGLSIILNTIFKINIPLFRIVFALLIIYFGVNMLMGSFKSHRHRESGKASDVFSSSSIKADPSSLNSEYNVVFGNQVVDLTAITDGADKTVQLNTVFGSQTVYVNEQTKLRIKASSVFAKVRLPDDHDVNFGDYTYNQEPADTLSAGILFIEANAVFGEIKIYKQKK